MIERQKQLATIVGEYGKSTAQWTIDDAIREINAYHQVCSFYRGMELVLEAVNKSKTGASANATAAVTPSTSLADVRLEYFMNEDLLRTTTDATERKALLAERTKLQGMIDMMLLPKPSEATPQVTIVSTTTTPTTSTSISTTMPATSAAGTVKN